MRSGKLDQRIVIQQLATAPDTAGQPVETPIAFATVWAGVRPIGGGEDFSTDQRTAVQRTEFEIRYLAGIEPTMQILHAGQLYDIKDIQKGDRGRRRQLIILAEVREKTSE